MKISSLLHLCFLLLSVFSLTASRLLPADTVPAADAHENSLVGYCIMFDPFEKNIVIQTEKSDPVRIRILDREGHITCLAKVRRHHVVHKIDFSRNFPGWYYVQLQLADGRCWGEWVNVRF
ncbi:MAG: hypothetical protein R3C61_27595 [Bacteroidia bacterium]